MALRLGRIKYNHIPQAQTAHQYQGVFWDTTALAWVERTVNSTSRFVTGADLQDAFVDTFEEDTFDWTNPAPPV